MVLKVSSLDQHQHYLVMHQKDIFLGPIQNLLTETLDVAPCVILIGFQEQVITKLVAYNNRDVLSDSSGGQKSERLRCQQGHTSPEGSRGDSLLASSRCSLVCQSTSPVSASVFTCLLPYFFISNIPLTFSYKDFVIGLRAHSKSRIISSQHS